MPTRDNKYNDKDSRDRMLTLSEVAHLLNVHPNTIRRWTQLGVLKAYRFGKRRDRKFKRQDVEEFLEGMDIG